MATALPIAPPAPDLVQRLGDEFAALVREDLTAEDFETMRQRNVSPAYADTGACASHDFRDANMIMADAFETVVGRAVFTTGQTGVDGEPVDMDGDAPEHEADCVLWGAAWDYASKRHLRADSPPA